MPVWPVACFIGLRPFGVLSGRRVFKKAGLVPLFLFFHQPFFNTANGFAEIHANLKSIQVIFVQIELPNSFE